MACFNFLGPCVNTLNYWHGSSQTTQVKSGKGKEKNTTSTGRVLSSTFSSSAGIIQARSGVSVWDFTDNSFSYHFHLDQFFVFAIQADICTTLATQSSTFQNMPAIFKERYPSTRVIIDATEIFVQQPHHTEFQQLTFSNYKNHNTCKGLVGISSSGAVVFVSDLSWLNFGQGVDSKMRYPS